MKVELKHILQNISTLMGFLLLLPGCGKLIDYGKEAFYQSPKLDSNREIAEKYLISVAAYDQLSTVVKLDALWLSDDVRKVYSELHALKYAKTDEQKKVFLRRQLEENNHFITFYVLSSNDISLGVPNSDWVVVLRIDGINYIPIEIKTVELVPEYVYIFGKKYNRFKTVYSIKFDAQDIDDQYLINNGTKSILLNFRTVEKDIILSWDLSKITKQEVVI